MESYNTQQTDVNGNKFIRFELSTGSTAEVREGTGDDVEKATLISGGIQSKYLSALMAATVSIDGKQIVMEDLSLLKMKDYLKIQVAFSELNF